MTVPSIEQLMFSSYIKYDKMKELVGESLSYSSADEINVYIDMCSLISQLYRGRVMINNYTSLTSSIINLCAHIREYFKTRHLVKSKIFIVFSRNIPQSAQQFYSYYNWKWSNTMGANTQMTDVLNSNLELLRIICPYLPDIFFIEDTFETGVVIYNLICKQEAGGNTNPNLIISKDPFAYQLVGTRPDITIFRPKKAKENGVDESWFVNSNNLYDKNRELTKTKVGDNHIMHPGLFSLLTSLTGSASRSVYAVYNISKASKIIEAGINEMKIANCHSSDIAYTLSRLAIDNERVSAYEVGMRFKAIDIVYQNQIYMNNPLSKTNTDSIINLHDPDTVRRLNNEYFINNPLDLNRL